MQKHIFVTFVFMAMIIEGECQRGRFGRPRGAGMRVGNRRVPARGRPTFGHRNTRPTFGGRSSWSAIGQLSNWPTIGHGNTRPTFGQGSRRPTIGHGNTRSMFGQGSSSTIGKSSSRPTFRTWASITGRAMHNRNNGRKNRGRLVNPGRQQIQATVPTTTTTRKPTTTKPTTTTKPAVADKQFRKMIEINKQRKQRQEQKREMLRQKEIREKQLAQTLKQKQAMPKKAPENASIKMTPHAGPRSTNLKIQREKERLLALKKALDEKRAAEIRKIKERTINKPIATEHSKLQTSTESTYIEKEIKRLLELKKTLDEKRKSEVNALAKRNNDPQAQHRQKEPLKFDSTVPIVKPAIHPQPVDEKQQTIIIPSEQSPANSQFHITNSVLTEVKVNDKMVADNVIEPVVNGKHSSPPSDGVATNSKDPSSGSHPNMSFVINDMPLIDLASVTDPFAGSFATNWVDNVDISVLQPVEMVNQWISGVPTNARPAKPQPIETGNIWDTGMPANASPAKLQPTNMDSSWETIISGGLRPADLHPVDTGITWETVITDSVNNVRPVPTDTIQIVSNGSPSNGGPIKQTDTTSILDIASFSSVIEPIPSENMWESKISANAKPAVLQPIDTWNDWEAMIPPNAQPAIMQPIDAAKAMNSGIPNESFPPMLDAAAVDIGDGTINTVIGQQELRPTNSVLSDKHAGTVISNTQQTNLEPGITGSGSIQTPPQVPENKQHVIAAEVPPGALPAMFEDVDLSQWLFDDTPINKNTVITNDIGNELTKTAIKTKPAFVTDKELPKTETSKAEKTNTASKSGKSALSGLMAGIISVLKNKGR